MTWMADGGNKSRFLRYEITKGDEEALNIVPVFAEGENEEAGTTRGSPRAVMRPDSLSRAPVPTFLLSYTDDIGSDADEVLVFARRYSMGHNGIIRIDPEQYGAVMYGDRIMNPVFDAVFPLTNVYISHRGATMAVTMRLEELQEMRSQGATIRYAPMNRKPIHGGYLIYRILDDGDASIMCRTAPPRRMKREKGPEGSESEEVYEEIHHVIKPWIISSGRGCLMKRLSILTPVIAATRKRGNGAGKHEEEHGKNDRTGVLRPSLTGLALEDATGNLVGIQPPNLEKCHVTGQYFHLHLSATDGLGIINMNFDAIEDHVGRPLYLSGLDTIGALRVDMELLSVILDRTRPEWVRNKYRNILRKSLKLEAGETPVLPFWQGLMKWKNDRNPAIRAIRCRTADRFVPVRELCEAIENVSAGFPI